MPEYLAPGVYVEEVSFRSKSIEGVPTSTTGFAGITLTGPVQYTDGPTTTEPRLITGFTEYERVYGGLEDIESGGEDRLNYMAHAARAFFRNGGKRLYISRVYVPNDGTDGIAKLSVTTPGGPPAQWIARWPGTFGNVNVRVEATRSKNIAFIYENPPAPAPADPRNAWGVQARRVRPGAIVEIISPPPVPPAKPPAGNDPLDVTKLYTVVIDPISGQQKFVQNYNPAALPSTWTVLSMPATNLANFIIQLVEMKVIVTVDAERRDVYNELGTDEVHKRYIGKILQLSNPEDENSVVWLKYDPTGVPDAGPKLMVGLQSNAVTNERLSGGDDGKLPSPDDLLGAEADPDVVTKKATGLEALGEIDDIAIVSLPDGGTFDDDITNEACADRLIGHAEKFRYRIAVVNGPQNASMSHIRHFRGKFDSKYAAIYHPWIDILDPLERPSQGAPPRLITIPPCGFVTGIYARSDIQRGVHKAPANEVVLGLSKFEININKARQDVLNPEGINALRFFEGRGSRVWGARTMSSDPEWKYVNVRRLFIYIEHSIDKGTQFAVFEPNNDRLWTNIRTAVEDFLLVLWRDGALLGSKPEEAYFVRCDRTTMTQNDLDNGRMICLIGVAPVKPAEYVIFRIGQFTADSKQ
jgi:Bacteriophage tail sheath protein